MFEQNKNLILGAIGAVLIWCGVYYFCIESNWAHAKDALDAAGTDLTAWDANYYKNGSNFVSRPEAVKAIEVSDKALDKNLNDLQRVLFYTKQNKDAMRRYTEAAVAGQDPNSYLSTMLKNLVANAGTFSVSVPADLSIDKATGDPVSLNLMRLALVERFILACRESGVNKVVKLSYSTPQMLPIPETLDKPPEKPGAKKDEKKRGEEISVDRLVQIPMKVHIRAPERNFGQLLYELQKPTVMTTGYFCVRGFHVAVQDANSGLIEATVAVSALIPESDARALNIPIKETPGGGKVAPGVEAPRKALEGRDY